MRYLILNTIILFCFSTTFVFANQSFKEAVFEYKDRAGMQRKLLKRVDKKYYIDGKLMRSHQWKLHEKYFKIILGKYKVRETNCGDNNYQLIIIRNEQERIENGCLDSLRFSALKKAFEELYDKTPIIGPK